MPNWLRGIFSPKPDNTEITSIAALKEVAISVWERDTQKNAEGYKVVRGDDGLPVEILETKSASGLSYSMLLNGHKHQFPYGDDVMKGYRELTPDLQRQSRAMAQFVVGGIKLFFENVERDNQFYALYGLPIAEIRPLIMNDGPIQ